MADLISRFDRWRQKLPARSRAFVLRAIDELVPLFERAGFGRYADYAGGNPAAVGSNCLPLQRRSGALWPTVEIQFDRGSRPYFNVVFSALPEYCTRKSRSGSVTIPRPEANVTEGAAYFLLC